MTLSELVNGRTNHCKFCKHCDNIGNCDIVERNVGWDIYMNKEVEDKRCPKFEEEKEE